MKLKLILICSLLVTIFYKTEAQDNKERHFVQWYFQLKEPINYTNNIGLGTPLETLKISLSSTDTLKAYNSKSYLVLSSAEKSQVLKQLRDIDQKFGDQKLLKKSKFIPREEIDAFLKDKAWGWINLSKRYPNGFYSFSKPIFIKGGDVCLFFVDYGCGMLCGNGDLAVYKKIEGKWTKWFVITAYLS